MSESITYSQIPTKPRAHQLKPLANTTMPIVS